MQPELKKIVTFQLGACSSFHWPWRLPQQRCEFVMGSSNKCYSVIISEQALEMLVSCSCFLAEVNAEPAENRIQTFETIAESL